MIGLSKISCIALLLCLPMAAHAQHTQELEDVNLTTGSMFVTDTANDGVVLGSMDVGPEAAVPEELPLTDEARTALVEELVEKAKVDNANRANMRKADLTETECLATAMYHEARGEGERGILAVAFVIYNRVKSAVFPHSYCEVVRQKAQFSFTSDRHPDNIKEWESYQKVLAMAVDLVDNAGFQRTVSPVGNALFFNSFHRRNRWTYARSCSFIATIGKLNFFK